MAGGKFMIKSVAVDGEVASSDGKYWGNTGLVPLRSTPIE